MSPSSGQTQNTPRRWSFKNTHTHRQQSSRNSGFIQSVNHFKSFRIDGSSSKINKCTHSLKHFGLGSIGKSASTKSSHFESYQTNTSTQTFGNIPSASGNWEDGWTRTRTSWVGPRPSWSPWRWSWCCAAPDWPAASWCPSWQGRKWWSAGLFHPETGGASCKHTRLRHNLREELSQLAPNEHFRHATTYSSSTQYWSQQPFFF